MPTNQQTPPIPVGLGTKLGLLAAALSALVAAIAALANGDHSQETIAALLIAGANVYGVVQGRMSQAAAAAGKPETVNQSFASPLTPIAGTLERIFTGDETADYDDEPEDDVEDVLASKLPETPADTIPTDEVDDQGAGQ